MDARRWRAAGNAKAIAAGLLAAEGDALCFWPPANIHCMMLQLPSPKLNMHDAFRLRASLVRGPELAVQD